MEIKVIIIDDEQLAIKRIANLLIDFKEVTIVDECTTGKKAINSINNHKPDLIFLDIQLRSMTGFDIIKNIEAEINPSIIFVTAYDEYAIKAFELYVFDYLLKPFKDERFFESTKRAINHINNKEGNGNDLKKILNAFSNSGFNDNSLEKIPIKAGNKVLLVDTVEIKYIIASGSYSEIYTDEKNIY